MSSVIKLEELLSSKVYVKENGAVTFKSPKAYLDPFLDIIGPTAREIRVQVGEAVINAEEGGKLNIAYPRVNIEAQIGDELTGFYSVIGMIYALNTQIPIAKVYTGQSVRTCLNLTVFNADDIYEQNLLGNSREIYNHTQIYKNTKEKQIAEYGKIYRDMTENHLTPQSLNDLMGKLLMKGARSKLGTSPVVGAAKLLTDQKTVYYTNEGADFRCSQWNVFNAVTQALGEGDPILRPNKTIELASIMQEG
jgi:hypothetical protein